MRTVGGAGCWPGRAEGSVVWVESWERARSQVADRAAEVLRFRAAVGQAVADLEAWSERQETLQARLLLQAYRDALLEDAWNRRTVALIDAEGYDGATAVMNAAHQISAVMRNDPSLLDRAEKIESGADWLAERLAPCPLPTDAILAAREFSPVFLLDRRHPALMAGPEPAVAGEGLLVWGVPDLGPDWDGRRVTIENRQITLDAPDPRWWRLDGDRINDLPICHVNGRPEGVERMARKLKVRPVAMVNRLEDLAAVPLFVAEAAAIAVDLDRLPRPKHPGVRLLLQAAAEAARAAGVPFLAGGEPAAKQPDTWFALGFTARFGPEHTRGGRNHAVRSHQDRSL